MFLDNSKLTINDVTPQDADKYAKHIENGSITGLRVSLDTVDKRAYAKQRGVKGSPHAENIKKLFEEYGKLKILVAYAAVNEWTAPHLPELVEFCFKYGLPQLILTPTWGDNLPLKARLLKATWDNIRGDILTTASETGLSVAGYEAIDRSIE